jgi:hypothetical protein
MFRVNGWRTSFGISNEVSGKHSYHRALERVGDLVLGPWPLSAK